MSSAALILAAGESRRMGSPKALLDFAGASFLDTLIGLLAPRCSPVIVVLGASADDIRAAAGRPAAFVVNAEWQRGQLTSMQCGLRAVPPEASGVLFTLVDHPAVASVSIDALLTAQWDRPSPSVASWDGPSARESSWKTVPKGGTDDRFLSSVVVGRDGPPVLSRPCHSSLENDSLGAAELLRVPRYRGRRGHPIWFSRELFLEFLDLPAGGAARDVVRRHAEDTAFLDLDDPGIVADIDDRADYAALLREAS